MITSVGIVASYISVLFVRVGELTAENVETKLKVQLMLSTILMTGLMIPLL